MHHQLNRLKEIGLHETVNKLIWRIKRAYYRTKFLLILRNRKIRTNPFGDTKRISFANENYLFDQPPSTNTELMIEAHQVLKGLFTVHDHGEVRWAYGSTPWNKWDAGTVRSFHRHDFLITLIRAYKESKNQEFLNTIKILTNLLPDCYPFELIAKYDKSIDIAIRILNWTAIVTLLLLDKKINLDDKSSVYWYQQIEWMKANMSPGGNHLLLEALALFAAGIFFSEMSVAKNWKEKGLKIVIEEMHRQVHHDGVHAEQSMFYHQICTTHFLKFFILCKKTNTALPTEFESRLRAMIDYVIAAEKPDGTHPMIGDGDMLVTGDREHWEAREMIACYKNGFQKEFIEDSSLYAGWFPIYPHYNNNMVRENHGDTSVFKDSGHVYFKDGLGQYLFFNCGQFGFPPYPHHGHSDALSVEICLSGHNITMDAGGYAYKNDSIRRFVRSTAAHNTVMIDGLEQSETSGTFNVGRTASTRLVKWLKNEQFDMALGMHEGYAPAIHFRKIWLLKNGWKTFVIRDYISGSGVHSIVARYHLSPDITHKQRFNNRVSFFRDTTCIGNIECWLQDGQISIRSEYNADMTHPVSIISQKSGQFVSSQLLSMQSNRHLPVSLVTIFSGYEEDKHQIDFELNKLVIIRNSQQFQLDISMEKTL